MSKRESIIRYFLIIKKLRQQAATFSEISDYLNRESELQGYNFTISKRTFQRDMEDIGSIYNIDIKYDFSRKLYFIDLDQQTEISSRIFEAFDIFNALNTSEQIGSYIHFENRRSQGTENLYNLLLAIKRNVQIKFSYHKFWENKSSLRTVEPFALKEFKNRWYLLANDLGDKKVKTFALDRLSELEVSNHKFQRPTNFNVHDYFKHCFGIISPNTPEPLEVVLSFNPLQGNYIKTLPIHESQVILIDNEQEFRIKITLYLTHDFFMEILSFGDNVKIIEPPSLITKISETSKRILKLYS